VEPQAGFEFALHGADVHRVPRPPPLWETTVLVVSYQGGDLTGLSYWGFRSATRIDDGDKVFDSVGAWLVA
jgi:peptidoglycan/xylan/chitin deacetylase (PgdA/CDA1 family)